MQLTNKKYFEIGLPYGSIGEFDDYPKNIDKEMPSLVQSADISDEYDRVLTLRLSSNKSLNIEAKDITAKYFLAIIVKIIQKSLIGKSLRKILHHKYIIASRLQNH